MTPAVIIQETHRLAKVRRLRDISLQQRNFEKVAHADLLAQRIRDKIKNLIRYI